MFLLLMSTPEFSGLIKKSVSTSSVTLNLQHGSGMFPLIFIDTTRYQMHEVTTAVDEMPSIME